jgi:hypothetical protein
MRPWSLKCCLPGRHRAFSNVKMPVYCSKRQVEMLGRVCKLGPARSTRRDETQRTHEYAMGAAPTAASPARTSNRPVCFEPSTPPQRHRVAAAYRCSLARCARTLWSVAHRGQPLLSLAKSRHLATPLCGRPPASRCRWPVALDDALCRWHDRSSPSACGGLAQRSGSGSLGAQPGWLQRYNPSQTAHLRTTPGCTPLSQAAAACWGSCQHHARGGAAGEERCGNRGMLKGCVPQGLALNAS